MLVASTGVIGEPLSIEPFKRGIPKLVQELSYTGSDSAAQGIMTTDTIKKEVAVEFAVDSVLCHIGNVPEYFPYKFLPYGWHQHLFNAKAIAAGRGKTLDELWG